MKNTAQHLGHWGSLIGLLAGLIELSIGSSILPWIGYKENPILLGLITFLLSLLAFISVFSINQNHLPTNDQKLATLLGILVPAILCFTTVGLLWYLPGMLLICTSFLLSIEYWHNQTTSNSNNLVQTKCKFNKVMSATGSILVLISIVSSFQGGVFSLYRTEIFQNNILYRIEVIPMDIVRFTNISSNIVIIQNSETSLIMIAYICLILGLTLSIISNITNSRLFLAIGNLVILSGLIFFIFWHPEINIEKHLFSLAFRNIFNNLGLGWYISFSGAFLIILSFLKD